MYTLRHFDQLRKTATTQDEQQVTKVNRLFFLLLFSNTSSYGSEHQARKIKKEDGLLSFSRMSREEVMRRWRAFGDTIGVSAYLKERPTRRLAFLELSICDPPEIDSTHEKLNHASLPSSSAVLTPVKGVTTQPPSCYCHRFANECFTIRPI